MHWHQLCHHGNSSRLRKYLLFLCNCAQVVHSEKESTAWLSRMFRNIPFYRIISPHYLSGPNVNAFVEATRRQELAIRRECHTVHWFCVFGECVDTGAMINIPQSYSRVKWRTVNNSTRNNDDDSNNYNNDNYYKYLTTEIQRMCNVKANVIPVITGATGTISKSFRKQPYWALHRLQKVLM